MTWVVMLIIGVNRSESHGHDMMMHSISRVGLPQALPWGGQRRADRFDLLWFDSPGKMNTSPMFENEGIFIFHSKF